MLYFCTFFLNVKYQMYFMHSAVNSEVMKDKFRNCLVNGVGVGVGGGVFCACHKRLYLYFLQFSRHCGIF